MENAEYCLPVTNSEKPWAHSITPVSETIRHYENGRMYMNKYEDGKMNE